MDHPIPLGQRIRFHPNPEALSDLRYDAPSMEGHVTSADRTSTGQWRYRLRNDDLVPVQPTVERIVYSHEGRCEPADPAPYLDARKRFERLRNAGDDPCPIQNAINALRVVAARTGESNLDVWERWGCYIGATEIAHRTGDQVARWMVAQLIREPWIDAALPRAGLPTPGLTGVAGVHRAIAQHDRSAQELDRFRAREEARIWDVETLLPDAPEIAVARACLASMVSTTARHRAELVEDLTIATRSEAAARERDALEALRAWSRPDARDLRKRPAPTSIFGWFPCDNDGVTAWSDGAMVDLDSEPHLQRWQAQRATGRAQAHPASLQRALPTSEGLDVQPIAVHATASRKSESFLVVASRCSVAFLAMRYWRYFASKFGQVQFRLHPANPVKDSFSVWHEGRRVGVVMPIQRPPMTREEVDALLDRADALRASEAEVQAA